MAPVEPARCPHCNNGDPFPRSTHPLAPTPPRVKPGKCRWRRGSGRIRTGVNAVRKCAGCDGTGVCRTCGGERYVPAGD